MVGTDRSRLVLFVRSNGAMIGAFTLIEVLVSISVIAILMGIMLPALGRVKAMGMQINSSSIKRQLVTALLAYGTREDEWIPGVNTSGLSLWPPNLTDRAVARLSRRPDAPVQNTDWMSPALGSGAGLSRSRNRRFYELLERFHDPALPLRVPVFTGGRDGNAQLAAWIHANQDQPARGVSFLMPMGMQLAEGEDLRVGWRGPWVQVGQRRYAGGLLMRQTRHPPGFVPRQTRVGQSSTKIACADGFRYLDSRRNALDFDAAYAPFRWGSFAGRTPLDQESRSWGRRGGGGDGRNLPLVYRHSGKMGVAFWDGHIDLLTRRQSRNPRFWAPAGSALIGASGTDPDSLTFGIEPVGKPFGATSARNLIP